MISASIRRRVGAFAATGRWKLAIDVAIQAALCALAGLLLPRVLGDVSDREVEHAFTVLSSGIAMAAAILLALAAWLSTGRWAVHLAFAVLVYEAYLLIEAIKQDLAHDGQLVGSLAMIGMAVLAVLAVGRAGAAARGWLPSALIAIGAVLGCVVLSLAPDVPLPAGAQRVVHLASLVVAVLAGLGLVWCGVAHGRRLANRIGLALLTITSAAILRTVQALPPGQPSVTVVSVRLAGVAMLLVAAVPFAIGALRAVWRDLAESQDRLYAAEAAMAYTALRDHEMRNLVAGLSGVESVLAAQEADEDSGGDREQLRAAARAELERLRRMLDGDGSAGPPVVEVAPLLTDLAALHGAGGAAIDVTVPSDLQAQVPPESLAHIVTNLLVNCARHAPGARVCLSATRCGDRIVIEVSDDGPGLPPVPVRELLEPGTRGPSSTGSGLGLHISALLARRHGGDLRLGPRRAGRRGCTAIVELPAVSEESRPPEPATR